MYGPQLTKSELKEEMKSARRLNDVDPNMKQHEPLNRMGTQLEQCGQVWMPIESPGLKAGTSLVCRLAQVQSLDWHKSNH